MVRRSTTVGMGALFAMTLVVAGSGPVVSPGDWAPRMRLVMILAAWALMVALGVLVGSAFTRADRPRLFAAVVVLSSLAALSLLPLTQFLIATVQLQHQKADVGAAISGFVQRRGRTPVSVRELFPQGDAPTFACDEFITPTYPAAVVLRDPRSSSTTGPLWRYDTAEKTWHTDTRMPFWGEQLCAPVSSPLAVAVMVVIAIFAVGTAYRPWRRLAP